MRKSAYPPLAFFALYLVTFYFLIFILFAFVLICFILWMFHCFPLKTSFCKECFDLSVEQKQKEALAHAFSAECLC